MTCETLLEYSTVKFFFLFFFFAKKIEVHSPVFYCMVFTTFDFLNRLCKCTVGGFGGAGGFVIYDETATNNENKANKENDAEDKENM